MESKTNQRNVLSGPTHWDTSQPIHFLRLEKDQLTVRYKGPGNQHQDIGTIRSNRPFSCNSFIDYFEIYIHPVDNNGETQDQQRHSSFPYHSYLFGISSSATASTSSSSANSNKRTQIMVGLSLANGEYVSTRYPGYDAYSWGFFSVDGKKFHDCKNGEKYAETGFGPGDTVGCGIIYSSAKTNQQQIFFTKNGKFLGTAFSGPSLTDNKKPYKMNNINNQQHLFYPTVGLHSNNNRITANFGQKKFLFDLQSMLDEQINNIKKEISSIEVSNRELHSWIREYLYVSGYIDTMKRFEETVMLDGENSKNEQTSNGDLVNGNCSHSAHTRYYDKETSHYRKQICSFIENGQIEQALDLISTKISNLAKMEHVMIRLHCQYIIEAIRNNNINAALEHAQRNLQGYTSNFILDGIDSPNEDNRKNHTKSRIDTLVLDTIGLLAYINPEQSPISYLLQPQYRTELSQLVNRAILEVNGEAIHSSLERAQMQLQVLSILSREEGLGAFHNHLNPANIQ